MCTPWTPWSRPCSVAGMPETATPERWWVTKTEAADRLGISRETFRRMLIDGQLRTVRVGRRDVVRITDIERIIEGGRN
jgi:excisionase family DNA binding protein